MSPAGDGARIPSTQPANIANVGIDQKLDTQVPPDLAFRDENGAPVRLGDYFNKGKPVLFTLVYFGCPRLCTTVLNEMNKALMPVSLNPGSDFEIVVVSFDPREGVELAGKKKDEYTRFYHRPGTEAGWHFLTGDQASIKALTASVGFRYEWDEAHQQFIHAGGLMVLTPQGKTSRYFYGIDYVPRDINLALLEARDGKIGKPLTLSQQVMLYCFEYDPHTGRYSIAIMNIVKAGGLLTVLGIGTFIAFHVRRDRLSTRAAAAPTAAAGPAGGDGSGNGEAEHDVTENG